MQHVQVYESFKPPSEEEPSQVAIYNTDEKRLIALLPHRKAAGIFVFGPLNDLTTNPAGRIWDAIAHKNKILPKSNKLGCTIAARNATPQQRELLGDQPYLLLDPSYAEQVKPLASKGMDPDVDHEMRKKAKDKPGNLKGLRYATKDKDKDTEPQQNPIR